MNTNLRAAILISLILPISSQCGSDSTPSDENSFLTEYRRKKTRNPDDPDPWWIEKAYTKFGKHMAGLKAPVLCPDLNEDGACHYSRKEKTTAIVIPKNHTNNIPKKDQELALLHELGHSLQQPNNQQNEYAEYLESPWSTGVILGGLLAGLLLNTTSQSTQQTTLTSTLKAAGGLCFGVNAMQWASLWYKLSQASQKQELERDADAFANKNASSIKELKKGIQNFSRFIQTEPTKTSYSNSIKKWIDDLVSAHPSDESRVQAIKEEIERRKKEGVPDPMKKSLAEYVQEQNPRGWYQRLKKFLQHTDNGASLFN